MARTNVDAWIQEEHDGVIVQQVLQTSAIERLARKTPMGTNTKSVNRVGSIGVAITAKGSAYNEEQPTLDDIALTARKFTGVIRLAEEDTADLPASGVSSVVSDFQKSWASSYAVSLDNACLGTTAAGNGTTIPFTSVYRAVTTADSAVSYTANANHIGTAGALAYTDFSNLFALAENGKYYDPNDYVLIAHPRFLGAMRGLVDGDQRPLFEGTQLANGTANLFGVNIQFSRGAVTSATMLSAPPVVAVGGAKGAAGNALMILAPKSHLILGVRSGPESVLISGRDGTAALTDEDILKMRSRRGFVVGDVNSIGVLEETNA